MLGDLCFAFAVCWLMIFLYVVYVCGLQTCSLLWFYLCLGSVGFDLVVSVLYGLLWRFLVWCFSDLCVLTACALALAFW